jgi:hypothetical protein
MNKSPSINFRQITCAIAIVPLLALAVGAPPAFAASRGVNAYTTDRASGGRVVATISWQRVKKNGPPYAPAGYMELCSTVKRLTVTAPWHRCLWTDTSAASRELVLMTGSKGSTSRLIGRARRSRGCASRTAPSWLIAASGSSRRDLADDD